jgi:hypothetical protein
VKTLSRILAGAALLALPACSPDESGPLVARANGHELTVNQAARLLSGLPDLPNDEGVVRALADLWMDYTLLAKAVAEDSTLRRLDLGVLLDQQFEQEMVLALRDSVVEPDTAVTDDELRRLFDADTPGARMRASHILMQVPLQATPAQIDSVRQRVATLAEQARAGADFAELAREHSQDPGSARQGGELGWFERGELVRPFEEAAFALEPGEISGAVETPMGFHVIRLDEKEVPGFDEVREDFRIRIQEDRYQHAESVYIAGIEEAAAVEVTDGAAEIVRELAGDPSQPLGSRVGRRALARYQGGTYTVAEALGFLRTREPQFLAGLTDAPDDIIEDSFLRGLVQRKLLVTEARSAGLGPSPAQRDSLADMYRTRFLEVATSLGLHPVERLGTESQAQAIDRVVDTRLRALVTGQAEMVPLSGISLVLRQQWDARVLSVGVQATVEQIARAGTARPAPTTPGGTPGGGGPPPVTEPDTAG